MPKAPNNACTDEVGSQGCHIKEKIRAQESVKQQRHHATFTELCKHLHRTAFGAVQVSVDKGCIMMLER